MKETKNFLIALPTDREAQGLARAIEFYISNAQFYFAYNGIEAYSKVGNAPPHVAFLHWELSKMDAFKIAENILSNKKFENVAVVLLSPIPAAEKFIDDVVIGRVQFLEDWKDLDKLPVALSKALNFSAKDESKSYRLKFLAAGDYLLREGDPCDYVYIVQRGELVASTQVKGKAKELGRISKSEFVGEMAYIDHEPRSADVKAVTACELIEIPVDILDQMLFQRPAWAKALMRTLSKRVKIYNQVMKKVKAV